MNRKKKTIFIALIVIGGVLLLYIGDALVPDPDPQAATSPDDIAYHRVMKLGCALVQYAAHENGSKFPDVLSDLFEKGYIKEPEILETPDGDRRGFAYEPRITPDMPAGVAVLWTKRPFRYVDERGNIDRYNVVFMNDYNVVPSDFRQFNTSQPAARAVLFAKNGNLAGRLKRTILRKSSERRNTLEVRCACYRLGELGEGADVLAGALGYAEVRFDAARALAALGDARGEKVLRDALLEPGYRRRSQAHEALKKLGRAVPGYSPLMAADARKEALTAGEGASGGK